jgi:hypothetical protein
MNFHRHAVRGRIEAKQRSATERPDRDQTGVRQRPELRQKPNIPQLSHLSGLPVYLCLTAIWPLYCALWHLARFLFFKTSLSRLLFWQKILKEFEFNVLFNFYTPNHVDLPLSLVILWRKVLVASVVFHVTVSSQFSRVSLLSLEATQIGQFGLNFRLKNNWMWFEMNLRLQSSNSYARPRIGQVQNRPRAKLGSKFREVWQHSKFSNTRSRTHRCLGIRCWCVWWMSGGLFL